MNLIPVFRVKSRIALAHIIFAIATCHQQGGVWDTDRNRKGAWAPCLRRQVAKI
jgi:hypothetical protein